MADTLSAAGAEFRRFLTATTSLDGSIATTYQPGAQVVVCDNTVSAAINSADTRVKVRRSPNSLAKLAQVHDALGIVHQVADISAICAPLGWSATGGMFARHSTLALPADRPGWS